MIYRHTLLGLVLVAFVVLTARVNQPELVLAATDRIYEKQQPTLDQVFSGSILLTVTNEGMPVTGATVKFRHFSFSPALDIGGGTYEFPAVPAGSYNVSPDFPFVKVLFRSAGIV